MFSWGCFSPLLVPFQLQFCNCFAVLQPVHQNIRFSCSQHGPYAHLFGENNGVRLVSSAILHVEVVPMFIRHMQLVFHHDVDLKKHHHSQCKLLKSLRLNHHDYHNQEWLLNTHPQFCGTTLHQKNWFNPRSLIRQQDIFDYNSENLGWQWTAETHCCDTEH